ncbi:hypothetical protein A3A75_03120 [Candidatus Woesebacteria bacterium RIFCSPLOWO2_01_FULL_39_10]|uniref:Uncharacterized protein n=1 Tax=Candidatus Woesebacteria bacterium RIFCSPLOWO2_01_FULL_39_10 TaxID=1802516 RepID=A0A1F8B570_9BACT|nr:MAG: hypothetical protein A3A75_03120 [Candidatus Woesebacteria bacterium RIFCSPLOWO2_01_FULL_39_10]
MKSNSINLEGDSDGHETSLLNLLDESPEWVRLPHPPPSLRRSPAEQDVGEIRLSYGETKLVKNIKMTNFKVS